MARRPGERQAVRDDPPALDVALSGRAGQTIASPNGHASLRPGPAHLEAGLVQLAVGDRRVALDRAGAHRACHAQAETIAALRREEAKHLIAALLVPGIHSAGLRVAAPARAQNLERRAKAPVGWDELRL